MADDPAVDVSVVVSVFNEEAALPRFWETLRGVLERLDRSAEVIFVNDGSVDGSRAVLEGLSSDVVAVRVIHFSRNFGHEAAMLAGIDHAAGESIICLDADLQHPPTKIPEMLAARAAGNDVVCMVRTRRDDGGLWKRVSSGLFYWLINRISPVTLEPNASDFFLISRRVARILQKEYRERARFLRGFIQSIGFRRATLEFAAAAREEGESKYSLSRLIVLSTEAVVAFSTLPLHLGLVGGVLCALAGIGVGGYSVAVYFLGTEPPPGYTTLVVLLCALFSFLFFLVGILGVYVGYIFEETKRRPIYLVEEVRSTSRRA
jgi:glycosyltransferase involved in cell wall biosynthesis